MWELSDRHVLNQVTELTEKSLGLKQRTLTTRSLDGCGGRRRRNLGRLAKEVRGYKERC